MRKQARQPALFLVCGETGVGKTYRNVLEIRNYLTDNVQTGKKGRKVLVFDVNDDDYPMIRTVNPEDVGKLRTVQARRIRPLTKAGRNMTLAQKRAVVEQLVHNFRDGLLVLEDIDKYMTGAKGQSVTGLLTTNRHNGLDIMISHQSIAKITTTEWQNCTWLRLHKQVDDISRYRSRIPNYFLVRIATLIVEEQYELATEAFAEGRISEGEYRKRKSFFLYLDMRKLKISGCSQQSFIRACKKYLYMEDFKVIRMMMNERDAKDNKIYSTTHKAVVAYIQKLLRHHQTQSVQGFASAA